jgi:hypothetical protein
MNMEMTKAEMLREIRRIAADLECALLRNTPVKICEESRRLVATADYAWDAPDIWTAERVDRALALLRQAAVQTSGTPSHDELVLHINEFQHRLTSLLVAKGAVDQTGGKGAVEQTGERG